MAYKTLTIMVMVLALVALAVGVSWAASANHWDDPSEAHTVASGHLDNGGWWITHATEPAGYHTTNIPVDLHLTIEEQTFFVLQGYATDAFDVFEKGTWASFTGGMYYNVAPDGTNDQLMDLFADHGQPYLPAGHMSNDILVDDEHTTQGTGQHWYAGGTADEGGWDAAYQTITGLSEGAYNKNGFAQSNPSVSFGYLTNKVNYELGQVLYPVYTRWCAIEPTFGVSIEDYQVDPNISRPNEFDFTPEYRTKPMYVLKNGGVDNVAYAEYQVKVGVTSNVRWRLQHKLNNLNDQGVMEGIYDVDLFPGDDDFYSVVGNSTNSATGTQLQLHAWSNDAAFTLPAFVSCLGYTAVPTTYTMLDENTMSGVGAAANSHFIYLGYRLKMPATGFEGGAGYYYGQHLLDWAWAF